MEFSKGDLFSYFSEAIELNKLEQQAYLSSLKLEQPELAEQLAKMLDSESDLTQFFSESFQAITTESQGASVGDMLNQFKLTQSLGNGGMGQVFKAERCDGKIEQTVAIKFLHPLLYQYQSGQLLLQEAQALAQLNHPNIATVYDIAETESNAPYIVMEYVDGVTLDKYLAKNQLSIDEKLMLFNQIADAVLEAHNHQIIHADIKPSNILITPSGQAKLIDFGIMQLAGELALNAPKIVTHYLCAMTVNYASPEQLNGSKATIASDIYGLGGLLFFILSGHSPFEDVGGSLHEKVTHISNNIAPQCAVPEKVKFKSDLLAILAKALAKQPNDRYRTVTDLINDIHAFQQYRPVAINSNLKLYNATKFLYRNRYLTTTVTFIFLIISVSLFQLQMKNEQIEKEKQQLANVSEELKRTYSQRDMSLADTPQSEPLYLPNPNKLDVQEYIEIMFLLFDKASQEGNIEESYRIMTALRSNVIQRLTAKELTYYLVEYRYQVAKSSLNPNSIHNKSKILQQIIDNQVRLDVRILKLFTFIDQEEYSTGNAIASIINNIEQSIDITSADIQSQFLFYYIKGRVIRESTQDYERAIVELEKAFELAKGNPSKIKLWQFLDALNMLMTSYRSWLGPNTDKVKSLVAEFKKAAFKLNKSNPRYYDIMGMLIRREMDFNMEQVEVTLKLLALNINDVLSSDDPLKVLLFKSYSHYLVSKSELNDAEKIAKHTASIVSRTQGENHFYYIYFLDNLAAIYALQRKNDKAFNLTTDTILPFASKHMSKDYVAYFKAKMCFNLTHDFLIKTSYHNVCKEAYDEHIESLGLDNYWTKWSLIGLISSQIKRNSVNSELFQKLIISEDSFHGRNLIKYYEVIVEYYLFQKDSKNAAQYLIKLDKILKSYFGSVDAIAYYTYQMQAAELAILQNNTQLAVDRLTEIKDKLCSLGDKTPHRIKYIKLTNSLNVKNCDAM